MFRPLVSLMLLTVSVAACGRETAPNVPAAPPSAPSAQQAAPATAQTAESRQATAAQESISDATSEERGDASLERLAAMPADQQLPNSRWKVGVNYKPVMPPQPTSVPAGKVEVIEVYWYGCPHCKSLEPYISSWLKNKPEHIELVRVPVMWSPGHRAHAKLFYTLEALGRHDLHQKVFDTIHNDKSMLLAEKESDTLKMQMAFAAANGIDAKKFMEAYNSFSVASNLQRAELVTQRYRVDTVPFIIVNGKYTTNVSMAGGPSQLLEVINDLAASEKRR